MYFDYREESVYYTIDVCNNQHFVLDATIAYFCRTDNNRCSIVYYAKPASNLKHRQIDDLTKCYMATNYISK